MDSISFAKTQSAVEIGKPSRLPAGSTLEVAPGIHVPHPHAEVNLPGAGDGRRGDTDAITENLAGEGRPLADEVKPASLTVRAATHVVPRPIADADLKTASVAEQEFAVDPENKTDESKNPA